MKPDKVSLFLTMIIILVAVSWISSCTHVADIANFPQICFEGEVLPIFTNNCAMTGCHDGRGETRMTLNNYAEISRGVVAGNPNGSRFYTAIIAKGGENMMPPRQPLSLENRTIIRLWIEQGAQETTCGGTGGNNPVVQHACFARDVLPVLLSKCATTLCHDAVTHKEGYNYSTYSSTMGSVVAGDPAASRLYTVITSSGGESKMPPANYTQLTTAEIDSIGQWISYGALNENCGEVCDTINPVTFSGTLWPIIQTNCTGCHSGNSLGGGIALTNYNDVKTVAANGVLMNSLNGTGVSKMPKGGSFSACRIRQFQIWINAGYLNN
jgi:mono/diheme cytochrome c family protein